MQARRSQVWCSLSSRKRKSDQRWLLAVAIVSVTKFFLSDTYSIIRRLLIHTFRFSRCNRALHKRCNGKKYFTYRSQTQQLSQFQFSFGYRFSWSTLRYKIFVPKVAHCIKSKFTSMACLYITPYSQGKRFSQGNRGVSKHDGNEDARKH